MPEWPGSPLSWIEDGPTVDNGGLTQTWQNHALTLSERLGSIVNRTVVNLSDEDLAVIDLAAGLIADVVTSEQVSTEWGFIEKYWPYVEGGA